MKKCYLILVIILIVTSINLMLGTYNHCVKNYYYDDIEIFAFASGEDNDNSFRGLEWVTIKGPIYQEGMIYTEKECRKAFFSDDNCSSEGAIAKEWITINNNSNSNNNPYNPDCYNNQN